MTGQNETITRSIDIDEKTMGEIMGYLKIEDHDLFVGYIKKPGN